MGITGFGRISAAGSGKRITAFCRKSDKAVILTVDEVDKNADNQIFLSFLGMLREKYLKQKSGRDDTFKSVILAGVYDIKNLKLVEENGRRLFLLCLKPIINGTGNYYIESRTRSMGRTDVIVDYLGKQYIVEMKIYHGNEYRLRGRNSCRGIWMIIIWRKDICLVFILIKRSRWEYVR